MDTVETVKAELYGRPNVPRPCVWITEPMRFENRTHHPKDGESPDFEVLAIGWSDQVNLYFDGPEETQLGNLRRLVAAGNEAIERLAARIADRTSTDTPLAIEDDIAGAEAEA